MAGVHIGKVNRVLTAIISFSEGVMGIVIEGLRPAAIFTWERIDCESKMMNFRFYADDTEVYHFQERMVLSLEKLRKNKKDEI